MSAALDALPAEIARHRVLGTRDASEFVGISVTDWRRMCRRGETPPPIKIGIQRQGWRVGDLIDWIASRAQPAA
jgi:predicted DNA-binding transcriptional regulator AlpA